MRELNHYEVLRIHPTADMTEIRRAYRERMLEAHPDKPGGDAELARMIDEARTVLLDPIARAKYDAMLAKNDLFEDAVNALSKVGGRAIDRLTLTVQVRGHDLLGALRNKATEALRPGSRHKR